MALNAFMTARAGLRRTDGFVLARRIAAGIIDIFLLSQLQLWINQLFGVVPGPNSTSYGLYGGGMVMDWGKAAVDVSWLVLIVVLYFFVQEALFSLTIGKLLMGLRVVNQHGKPISIMDAFVRNVLRPIDALPAYYILGIIAATYKSPAHQRLGDRAAGTTVVSMREAPLAVLTLNFLSRLLIFGLILALGSGYCWQAAYYEQPTQVVENWHRENSSQIYGVTIGTPSSPTGCGITTGAAEDYFLGDNIILYQRLAAQRNTDGTLSYPVTYQLESGKQACAAKITLRWQGLWQGGWKVTDVAISPQRQ